MPYGPKGKEAITAGYFAAAMTMDPKPKTIAMTGADAEFAKNAMAGAREHIKKIRSADRLRQELPAQHGRLQPDRARDQGDQPGSVLCRLISRRQRRDAARGRGAGARRQVVRRADDRAAIRHDQIADGRAAERHRRLRAVRPRADDELPRGRRLYRGIPEARQGGRHRPARLLRAAAGLRDLSGTGAGGRPASARSTRTSSRNTCTRQSSRRSWATSSSARTANGPSRAS